MAEERSDWGDLRERRMAEPGAAEAYEAARMAYELGRQYANCENSVAGVRLGWPVKPA